MDMLFKSSEILSPENVRISAEIKLERQCEIQSKSFTQKTKAF